MQQLKPWWKRLRRSVFGTDRVLDAATTSRRELRLGVTGALLLALALLATGVLYAVPFGKSTYTADLSEAQSIKVGDQVRLAGIEVGTVTGLDLRPDRVRMTFTVDDEVFVGDRTTLDIRMLTVIGGHYVALTPAGDTPLGDTVIPADRVRLPYSLLRSMQDAADPLGQVDGGTLHENLAALQDSLDGSPDAVRRMGRAMQSFVTILDQQNADVSRALTVADEYLTTIDTNKSLLGTFVRKVGLLATVGLNKRAEILAALEVTSQLLSRIAALEPVWRTTLEPLVARLAEAVPQLRSLAERLGGSVDTVNDLGQRLQNLAAPGGPVIDQSGVTLPVAQLCVPVPGRSC